MLGQGQLLLYSISSIIQRSKLGTCPLDAVINLILELGLSLRLVSQMIRDCGAGRIGPLTSIGLGTFVDPLESVSFVF